jgi:hypothetical protein
MAEDLNPLEFAQEKEESAQQWLRRLGGVERTALDVPRLRYFLEAETRAMRGARAEREAASAPPTRAEADCRHLRAAWAAACPEARAKFCEEIGRGGP